MQLQKISTYIDLLLRWNARINLTAIRDPEQIVTRHFGESLFLARHLFPDPSVGRTLLSAKSSPRSSHHPDSSSPQRSDGQKRIDDIRVLDIGSGAGFPGVPLKLWAPEISLTLVESNHKKATFLREAIRALTLTSVNVITARAETLPNAAADVVTVRAVEHFDQILPLAFRLVAPSGRLALLIGQSQLPALQNLAPDFHVAATIPIPNSNSRVVSILVNC